MRIKEDQILLEFTLKSFSHPVPSAFSRASRFVEVGPGSCCFAQRRPVGESVGPGLFLFDRLVAWLLGQLCMFDAVVVLGRQW